MNIERCCKNEKNKMLKSLLNIPENIVISIGPTGCLNVLYNEAIKENKLGNLYTFPVSEIDMVSANHIEKLEKYIVKIISENFEKIKSIIIYLTCADLILVSDFSFLIISMAPSAMSSLFDKMSSILFPYFLTQPSIRAAAWLLSQFAISPASFFIGTPPLFKVLMDHSVLTIES